MLFNKPLSFYQYLVLSFIIHFSLFFSTQNFLKNQKVRQANIANKKETVFSIKNRILLVKDHMDLNLQKSQNKFSKKNVVDNSKKVQRDQVNDRTTAPVDSGVNTKLSKYLSEVRNTIVRNRFKNKVASQLKLKGPVELAFVIEKPNILKEVQVLKSSGYAPLDQSALQTLKKVDHFPKIPEDLELNRVSINFTVEYL